MFDHTVIAHDDIVTGRAIDEVAAIGTVSDIMTTIDIVVAAAAVDRVTTLLSKNDVVTGIGIEHCKRATVEGVVAGGGIRSNGDIRGIGEHSASILDTGTIDGADGIGINITHHLAVVSKDQVAIQVAVNRIVGRTTEDKVVTRIPVDGVISTVSEVSRLQKNDAGV